MHAQLHTVIKGHWLTDRADLTFLGQFCLDDVLAGGRFDWF